MLVPRDGGLRARVVLGGAGEDFAFVEVEENNLEVKDEHWYRWYMCSLCEQQYHGVVRCALGWACWKTIHGRPETTLASAHGDDTAWERFSPCRPSRDALIRARGRVVYRAAAWCMKKTCIPIDQSLANSYEDLGRFEESLCLRQDVYSDISGTLRNMRAPSHCSQQLPASLVDSSGASKKSSHCCAKRYPWRHAILGENDQTTLKMRGCYARPSTLTPPPRPMISARP